MTATLVWVLVATLCALALFPYAGYPLLVLAFPRRRSHRGAVPPGDVSVVIPARNEARTLASKLDATLRLEPRDRVREVIVGSDGSTDGTAAIVRTFAASNPRVRLVDCAIRRGKAAVLDDLLRRAQGEFVLFTDASAHVEPHVLPALLDAMADPDVGVAMPRYQTRGSDRGEGHYWRFQTALKRMESDRGLLVGAHGACYLARMSLVPPIPVGTINDDLLLPALIRARGATVAYVHDVAVSEDATSTTGAVFRRLARISRGNWLLFLRHTGLLSPLRLTLAVPLLATKLLRILGPWLLLAAIAVLVGAAAHLSSARVALAAGIVVVVLAAVGLWGEALGARMPRSLGVAGYALLGQVATFVGALQAAGGSTAAAWDSVEAPSQVGQPQPPRDNSAAK